MNWCQNWCQKMWICEWKHRSLRNELSDEKFKKLISDGGNEYV